MLRLSLVSYAVGGTFLGLAYFDLYFDVVAAVVILKILVQRQVAQEAADHRALRVQATAAQSPMSVPARASS
jgi:hypothetical protein